MTLGSPAEREGGGVKNLRSLEDARGPGRRELMELRESELQKAPEVNPNQSSENP